MQEHTKTAEEVKILLNGPVNSLPTPFLPDGEIDYRYSMAAMINAGFQGYMALESLRAGDQWERDRLSLDYVKALAEELESGNGQEPS